MTPRLALYVAIAAVAAIAADLFFDARHRNFIPCALVS